MLDARQLPTWFALLEKVPVSVIVTDAGGQIVLWNRFAEELFGWSFEEVRGRPILDVTVADGQQELAASILARIAEGDTWEGEFLARRRDDTPIEIRIVNAPLVADDGTVTGVVGVAVDQSGEARARRWFQELVEHAVEVVAVADREGTLRYAAPATAELLGRRPEDVVGQPFTALVVDDDVAQVEAVLTSVAGRGDSSQRVRFRMLRDGRDPVPVEAAITNLIDSAEVRGLVLNLRDVSELVAAEQATRRALERERGAARERASLEQLRRTLIDATWHQLRTPLSVVLGTTALLEEHGDEFARDERRDLYARLRHQAERLDELVGEVLELQQAERGELFQPDRSPVALAELIHEVVDELDLDTHHVRLDLAPVTIAADAVMLRRAVGHLLDNVRRHTPAGTHATVTLRADEQQALLDVVDSGPGLPPALQGQATRPFVTGPVDPAGRLGLGLALARDLIEAHGGHLELGSPESQGTAVRVSLPLVAPG